MYPWSFGRRAYEHRLATSSQLFDIQIKKNGRSDLFIFLFILLYHVHLGCVFHLQFTAEESTNDSELSFLGGVEMQVLSHVIYDYVFGNL